MRPRFQADADLNNKIVLGIHRREPAIDFQTARTGGVIGEPDLNVLAIAATSDRILVSHDRKTMPSYLSQFLERRASPGVILVPQELEIGRAIDDLVLIWSVTQAEEWHNGLGFLPV